MAATRHQDGTATSPAPQWADDIFRAFVDLGIRQVAYVPDAGHTRLIEACNAANAMRAVSLTSEEEGVALLAGAWLGGQRGALLMQSSGVGNCINTLSMTRTCRFPLLMVVTMRGEWGETNPWQVPMGQTAAETLKLQGVIVHVAATAADVGPMIAAAGGIAFNGPAAAAVLISQRIIGTKEFKG
ncbi:MAG: thiamine pyrophosphate-binding protein [Rhodospirillales bacterium]|jgi:sulfopyruvate decarboxylase alpha subunit|nr:thiamine pyrophosphate-binding protein [Rhodospirillales bacterium]